MVPQIINHYGSGIKGLVLGPLSKQMGRFNPRSPSRERASLMMGIQELSFLLSEVFGFIKFYDATTVETDPANFYMEREWRCLTNINFSLSDVSRIILPTSLVERFRADFAEYKGDVLKV
jgi:hypothetical protein